MKTLRISDHFRRRCQIIGLCLMTTLFISSCYSAYKKSVGGDTDKVFTKIYLTDFNTSWQAVLDALKSHPLDISNRETGIIQTKWKENTAEKNFSDSFGSNNIYLKAQFRVKVKLSKGFYNGESSVKVVVQREQLIQQDVLEGWKKVETDSIEEETLLYRIGRIIAVRMELAKLEEIKVKKDLERLKRSSSVPILGDEKDELDR